MLQFVRIGDRIINFALVATVQYTKGGEVILTFVAYHPGAGEMYEEWFVDSEARLLRAYLERMQDIDLIVSVS